MSYVLIQRAALVAIFVLVFIPPSTNKLFKYFIKTYLENKNKNQIPAAIPKKVLDKSFKTTNLILYFENMYMKSFYYCQQYEDYFETTRVKNYKRVVFVVLFLWNKINFC